MNDLNKIELDVSWIKIAVFGLIAFVIAILSLPMIQSLLYAVIIGTPSVVQWGLVSVFLAGVGLLRQSENLLLLSAAVFVVLGLFIGPIAGGVYAHADMADQMQADATELETLPNTSTENVRVLPRTVSDNYAQSSMQYPQYRLTTSDIAYRDGSYRWSHGLQPDNFMVALFGAQRGALYVNMTKTEKDVQVKETEFSNGRGQLFVDSYRYQNVLNTPFKRHNWDTTFNARVNNTSYIAHSTTVYEWRFRLTPIPQFYAVPKHGSVEVMHPDGQIDSLSPSEAHEAAMLEGQNVYPYEIAMFKVESMQYVHGALNKWFWKEDVLAIADLPEQGNNWPIVVPTEEESPEMTYFVATEPSKSGDGVYEVWTIDGQTGDVGVQRYSESQIGPQKAVDFVERHPQVNRLSNANAVAPVPIVQGDRLYWHVKVVPESRSGVVYTAFVNAKSGDVTLIEGTTSIYAFLSESQVAEVQNQTNGQQEGMTVTVVVTDANGEIVGTRNITVPKGGEAEINIRNENTTNATAQA